MTERQKYLFDLQGYVVVEDVVSDEVCELAIEKITSNMQPVEKTPDGYEANGTWHAVASLFNFGRPFIDLDRKSVV